MLKKLINQSPYVIFFPVVDPSLTLSIPDLQFLHLIFIKPPKNKPLNRSFCLNSPIKPRTEYLLSNPKTIDYINKVSKITGKKIAIMPFKPSAKIDLLCQQKHWLKICNNRQINLQLEDKVSFSKICKKYHIPMIPHLITRFNSININLAKKIFTEDTLVVQTKTGWAGNSTYLVNDNPPIPENAQVKLMPFLEGTTITTNNCIYHNSLISSPPADQLNNPKHTTNIFATTGRKWPSTINQTQINQISDINLKIHKLLNDINFRGFFGLDFFLDKKGQIFLMECNPRLTASFNFYTNLELKHKLEPLLYFHLAEFLEIPILSKYFNQNRFTNKSIKGSQVTIRDNHDKIIKTITKC